MTDDPAKTPVEQAVEHALELFVYAPIGLLFDGATVLPQLIERGRSQVSTARLLGRFAVRQGRSEATKAAGRLQDHAVDVLGLLGDSVAAPPATRPAPAATRPAPTRPEAAPDARASAAPAPRSSASLAIPDYDGLSASQVVNRLAGLSPSELAAVQRYETANRGRKTILSKVAQLQGS